MVLFLVCDRGFPGTIQVRRGVPVDIITCLEVEPANATSTRREIALVLLCSPPLIRIVEMRSLDFRDEETKLLVEAVSRFMAPNRQRILHSGHHDVHGDVTL